jgi:hypothetical protein
MSWPTLSGLKDHSRILLTQGVDPELELANAFGVMPVKTRVFMTLS